MNARGAAALIKLGAVPEGTLRRCFRCPGGLLDHTMSSILAEDWRERRTTRRRVCMNHNLSSAGRTYVLSVGSIGMLPVAWAVWSLVAHPPHLAWCLLAGLAFLNGDSAFVSHRCERPFRCPRESSSRPRSCLVLRLR